MGKRERRRAMNAVSAFAIAVRDQFMRRAGVGLLLPFLIVLLFFAFHGVAALGLKGLDPFGLGAASGERSEQVTQRVLAPFYAPSNKVTVVLIDDQYLRDRQVGWPLSYAEQGLLLRRVLSAAPAALVIDLVYPHRHAASVSGRADAEALFKPIDGDTTTPVIFTAMAREFATAETATAETAAAGAQAGGGNSSADRGVLPAGFTFCGEQSSAAVSLNDLLDTESIQRDLRDQILQIGMRKHDNWHLALVRWSGCGSRYPLMLGGNADAVTPALAAYRAACVAPPQSWSEKANRPQCVSDAAQLTVNFREPLRIRWGAFPPWEQRFSSDERTCQPSASRAQAVPLWRRLGVALRELTVGMFKDMRKSQSVAERLPCPAIAVAPMSLLAKASASEWRELIQDRVVLVGASVSGIPDVIVSPVHGQLPGVLLHAMAVDNLLHYGVRYPADRYREATELLAFALVLAFAYSLPFLFWLLEHPRLRRTLAMTGSLVWLLIIAVCVQQRQWPIVVSAVLLAICLDLMRPTVTASYFVILTLAAVLAGVSQMNGWPPGNWLGLLLLLFGFTHTVKPFYHGADRSRLPSRYSLLAVLWQRLKPTHITGSGT